MGMNYIDEMVEDIVGKKKTVDYIAFLKFLKEEVERKGIRLTVNCQKAQFAYDDKITPDVIGIELDLSDHDKEKDAEIEKYKKSFESAKCERDKAVCEYRNEIERLKRRVRELEESQEKLPTEPLKMADWIAHHFKQGEEYPIYEREMDGKLCYVDIDGNKVPVQTGEYGKRNEVREIVDYLLVHCKYHSEVE